jgi:hypothetical protein
MDTNAETNLTAANNFTCFRIETECHFNEQNCNIEGYSESDFDKRTEIEKLLVILFDMLQNDSEEIRVSVLKQGFYYTFY